MKESVFKMSEQIQAIIRLKHIHEFGPHYIPSTIPICPPSVIPEITVVPYGTSPYILLTIWFLHYGYPVQARVLRMWTGVPVMVGWWSDGCWWSSDDHDSSSPPFSGGW